MKLSPGEVEHIYHLVLVKTTNTAVHAAIKVLIEDWQRLYDKVREREKESK